MSPLPPLPLRDPDAHKGNFGRILIIGGSEGMAGAPAMAAMAALRSGAGLVQVACPQSVQQTIMSVVPCATTCRYEDKDAFRATVQAIGPGCGSTLTQSQMRELLAQTELPTVVDADGLNLLATMTDWWEFAHRHAVLTPHPGEMSRLVEPMGVDASRHTRESLTLEVAKRSRAVVLLKGRGTVVSNGTHTYVNTTGNPGMASGGSGDVLTGVIAALLGQGISPYDAACLGAHLHGAAGDLAAKRFGLISMIATDIIECLPDAFLQHESATQINPRSASC